MRLVPKMERLSVCCPRCMLTRVSDIALNVGLLPPWIAAKHVPQGQETGHWTPKLGSPLQDKVRIGGLLIAMSFALAASFERMKLGRLCGRMKAR